MRFQQRAETRVRTEFTIDFTFYKVLIIMLMSLMFMADLCYIFQGCKLVTFRRNSPFSPWNRSFTWIVQICKKKNLQVICVTSPAAFFPPVGNGRNGPALLCLWLAYLGAEARIGLSRIFFMPAKRPNNTLSVLIVQIRIRYHLNLQRVYFYFCIVIITMK